MFTRAAVKSGVRGQKSIASAALKARRPLLAVTDGSLQEAVETPTWATRSSSWQAVGNSVPWRQLVVSARSLRADPTLTQSDGKPLFQRADRLVWDAHTAGHPCNIAVSAFQLLSGDSCDLRPENLVTVSGRVPYAPRGSEKSLGGWSLRELPGFAEAWGARLESAVRGDPLPALEYLPRNPAFGPEQAREVLEFVRRTGAGPGALTAHRYLTDVLSATYGVVWSYARLRSFLRGESYRVPGYDYSWALTPEYARLFSPRAASEVKS